jgi:hypothetical protein
MAKSKSTSGMRDGAHDLWVLRDHILRGYTVNERRLRELQQTIRLVSTLADRRALSGEGRSV